MSDPDIVTRENEMNDHTVTAFDDDLKSITAGVNEMGGYAESMIGQAVSALTRGDLSLAQAVVAEDVALDNMQYKLDEQIVLTIAKRQPVALDLREVIGALRMASDLERVGDMAKNIAKRTKDVVDFAHPKPLLRGIEHLSSLAQAQLRDVLDAYVNKDIAQARKVLEHDDEIDQVYTSLFRELLTYMMEDPRNISFCTHLLFCAKNIERVGDHATNIAETILYIVTGEAEQSMHGTRTL
ncbi:MAG: phosphate signaling complex protein PhoU [Rhizobiaceae bacterium]